MAKLLETGPPETFVFSPIFQKKRKEKKGFLREKNHEEIRAFMTVCVFIKCMQGNTRKQLKNKYFIPNSIKNT